MHDKINTYGHQGDANGNHLMTIVNNIVLNPGNLRRESSSSVLITKERKWYLCEKIC